MRPMVDPWLRAFHAGEESVFERALIEHSARLLAYARGYVHDDTTAEDLVQETWLRAYRRRSTFRGEGSFLGWLLAISRSVALDYLRDKKRLPEPTCESRTAAEQFPTPPEFPNWVEQQYRASQAHRVRAAVTELPPRQRDTVVLRILEGKSVQETAQAMNCAEGTVKAALSKAMRNLRTILKEDGAYE